jgi:hypothetical protein
MERLESVYTRKKERCDSMDEKELPLGFAFRLASNQAAMENFANMTEEEKRQVIEAARTISGKSQMQNLVDEIGRLT